MLWGPDPELSGIPKRRTVVVDPRRGTDATRVTGRVPVSDGLRYGLVSAALDHIVRVKMYDLCRGLNYSNSRVLGHEHLVLNLLGVDRIIMLGLSSVDGYGPVWAMTAS